MNKEPEFLFAARGLDHVLRRRHAESYSASIAAVLACAAYMNIVQSTHNPSSFSSLLASEASSLVILAVVFALGTLLFVRVWCRFWRRGRDRWEILVYGFGVRGFGAMLGLLVFGWCAWGLGQYAFAGDYRGGFAVLGVLAGILMGGVIGLVLGYLWGVQMAALAGVERNKASSDSELPLVTD